MKLSTLLVSVTITFFFSFHIILAQGIIKDDYLVNDDVGSADQFVPSISRDAVGNFVVVWFDFRNADWDIFFQRYNDTGAALGVNTKVNDDSADASQEYPSISMDPVGNFVIVWDDNRKNNYDIYFQRYTSTGGALGGNTKVNDDVDSVKQWDSSIAMDATGNFVVAWTDERNGNQDIYFQRYTSTGGALGINTKVNDDATTANQISPSISVDATGNFIVAWQDFRNSNWDIYYQRYTDTGTTLGINTKVNDDAGGEFQYYPSISMDPAGTFIIVWQDFRNSNWDIYYQRYTDTGTTLGVNTKVNDDVGNAYQKVPSISMDGAGDFVIVWQDNRSGQTNSDIIGQRYFSNGNPNGVNYRVVADGPNNGEISPVICSYNSNIILSWQDNRRSQGWDIYAKIVSWNWNGVATVIEEDNRNPHDFSLSQNHPNPFNPSTTIEFDLPNTSIVTLKIFNILGEEVATLVAGRLSAGNYKYNWDATGFASGVYLYQLQAGGFVQTKKLILLK